MSTWTEWGRGCSSKFLGCPREGEGRSKNDQKLSMWYMDGPIAIRLTQLKLTVRTCESSRTQYQLQVQGAYQRELREPLRKEDAPRSARNHSHVLQRFLRNVSISNLDTLLWKLTKRHFPFDEYSTEKMGFYSKHCSNILYCNYMKIIYVSSCFLYIFLPPQSNAYIILTFLI